MATVQPPPPAKPVSARPNKPAPIPDETDNELEGIPRGPDAKKKADASDGPKPPPEPPRKRRG